MPRKRKRKRARITPEIVGRMVELRKQGFTYKEISRGLDVAFQTVAMHMQAKKMGGRRKKVTEKVLEEMKNLRETGASQKEIAGKLNLSYATVSRYLGRGGFFERMKRRMGLE